MYSVLGLDAWHTPSMTVYAENNKAPMWVRIPLPKEAGIGDKAQWVSYLKHVRIMPLLWTAPNNQTEPIIGILED